MTDNNQQSNQGMAIRILEQQVYMLQQQNKMLSEENNQLKTRVRSLMAGIVRIVVLTIIFIVIVGVSR